MYEEHLTVVKAWIADPCSVTQAELNDNYYRFSKEHNRHTDWRLVSEQVTLGDVVQAVCLSATNNDVEGAAHGVKEYYRLKDAKIAEKLKLEIEHLSSPKVQVPILMEKVKTMELQIKELLERTTYGLF